MYSHSVSQTPGPKIYAPVLKTSPVLSNCVTQSNIFMVSEFHINRFNYVFMHKLFQFVAFSLLYGKGICGGLSKNTKSISGIKKNSPCNNRLWRIKIYEGKHGTR